MTVVLKEHVIAKGVCALWRSASFSLAQWGILLYNTPKGGISMEPTYIDPRRRFFARYFDALTLYAILISAVALLARVRPFNLIIVMGIPLLFVHFLLILIIEPVFVHKWGTTPGKWLMGLSISDWDDCYPTLELSQRRTWGAVLHGQGLTIPILAQVFNKKAYDRIKANDPLEWEYDTTQVCDTPRRWKEVLAAVLAVAMVAGTVLAVFSSDWVPNRGDLTWKEFCRNYNVVSNYYEAGSSLMEDGTLQQDASLAGGTHTSVTYLQENGVLKSVTMTVRSGDTLMSAQDSKLLFMTLAAVKSRVSPLSTVGEDMVEWMLEDPFSDCVTQGAGITVRRDWEIDGFDIVSGNLRTEDPAATAVMTITVEFGE